MGKVNGKWQAPSPETPEEQAQRLLDALKAGHFVPAWSPSFAHKGCGGELVEDWSETYDHEGCTVPSVRCLKCKAEILGDAEVDYE
jgi:hypothetical protein